MNKSRVLLVASALMFSVLLAGCGFEHPPGVNSGAEVDQRLAGHWVKTTVRVRTYVETALRRGTLADELVFERRATPYALGDYRQTSSPKHVQTGTANARSAEADSSFLRCERGEALFCMSLGHRFRKGEGAAKDEARAASYYDRACDLGRGMGCAWFARTVGKTQVSRALAAAKRACKDLKEPAGCTAYGDLERDPMTAALYYAEGCAGGDDLGCDQLADMCIDGQRKEACAVIDRLSPQAYKRFEKATGLKR